jgi:acyl dehydratase
MPLRSSIVGADLGRVELRCDARWLMAYAAGVPDERPELYDTIGGLAVHPLFSVAPEWQLVIAARQPNSGLTPNEMRRGVHTAHDVVWRSALVPGETVTVTARVVGIDRGRAGARQHVELTATGADGALRWRTRMSSLFLAVELEGEARSVDGDWPAPPAAASGDPVETVRSRVGLADAHAYSECARIWNPIHTDAVAARAAGLASPILHGTATLARAVSITSAEVGVPPGRVARITARFVGQVPLGSYIDVHRYAAVGGVHPFEVHNAAGAVAVAGAWSVA